MDSLELANIPNMNTLILKGNRFAKMSLLRTGSNIKCKTSPNTLEWFGITEPNEARSISLVDTRVMVVRKSFFSMIFMKLWIACALDIECIGASPRMLDSVSGLLGCELACGCHRYDQSALSIINYIFMNALF